MSQRAKRRTVPGEESELLAPEDLQNELSKEQSEAIAAKGKLEDWLDALTPEQCQQLVVWVYRLRGNGQRSIRLVRDMVLPSNANGCTLEDWLQTNHGGGNYKVHVKFPGLGKRADEHNGIIEREGAPIYPAAPPPEPGQPSGSGTMAPAGPAADAINLRILDKLDDLGKPRGDDPLTRATGKIMDKALESFVEGPEKPAGLTGNPSLDALLVPLIAKALTPAPVPAPVDPVQSYLAMDEAFSRIAARQHPPAAVAPGAGRTSDMVELVKAGGVELAKQIYGNAIEPASLGSAVGEALSAAVKERPGVLLEAFDLLKQSAGAMLARFAAPPPGGVPAIQAQPSTAPQGRILPPEGRAAQPAGSAGDNAGPAVLGMPPQAVIDDVFSILVRNYRLGLDGTTVGIIILGAFPGMQPFLQMVCSNDLALVLPELEKQPAIAPIVHDARFPEFYEQFRELCLSGLGPVDDDPEDAGFGDESDGDPVDAAAAGQAVQP